MNVRWRLLDASERDMLRSLALGQLPLRIGDVIPVEIKTLELAESEDETLGEYELVITLAVRREGEE